MYHTMHIVHHGNPRWNRFHAWSLTSFHSFSHTLACSKFGDIIFCVLILQMATSVICQVEVDELVTEYTIISHSTSISSTAGSPSSTSGDDENISTSDDGEIEARSNADSVNSGSNLISISSSSSSLPTDSTVASDVSSISDAISSLSSSSTRQYIAVTQTPVIAKRKGVLKAETADVQVNRQLKERIVIVTIGIFMQTISFICHHLHAFDLIFFFFRKQ